jgi:hypothetical protein
VALCEYEAAPDANDMSIINVHGLGHDSSKGEGFGTATLL